jgi:hypothetical protein
MAPEIPEQYIALRSQWPKYPLDQYHYQVSQLTSITSKTRTFYAIPLAGHITVNSAAVGYYCSLHLICSWAFPDLFSIEWSDPKCIRDLPTTIDFVGATQRGQKYSMKFLNVTQPFGNDSSNPIRNLANFQYFN